MSNFEEFFALAVSKFGRKAFAKQAFVDLLDRLGIDPSSSINADANTITAAGQLIHLLAEMDEETDDYFTIEPLHDEDALELGLSVIEKMTGGRQTARVVTPSAEDVGDEEGLVAPALGPNSSGDTPPAAVLTPSFDSPISESPEMADATEGFEEAAESKVSQLLQQVEEGEVLEAVPEMRAFSDVLDRARELGINTTENFILQLKDVYDSGLLPVDMDTELRAVDKLARWLSNPIVTYIFEVFSDALDFDDATQASRLLGAFAAFVKAPIKGYDSLKLIHDFKPVVRFFKANYAELAESKEPLPDSAQQQVNTLIFENEFLNRKHKLPRLLKDLDPAQRGGQMINVFPSPVALTAYADAMMSAADKARATHNFNLVKLKEQTSRMGKTELQLFRQYTENGDIEKIREFVSSLNVRNAFSYMEAARRLHPTATVEFVNSLAASFTEAAMIKYLNFSGAVDLAHQLTLSMADDDQRAARLYLTKLNVIRVAHSVAKKTIAKSIGEASKEMARAGVFISKLPVFNPRVHKTEIVRMANGTPRFQVSSRTSIPGKDLQVTFGGLESAFVLAYIKNQSDLLEKQRVVSGVLFSQSQNLCWSSHTRGLAGRFDKLQKLNDLSLEGLPARQRFWTPNNVLKFLVESMGLPPRGSAIYMPWFNHQNSSFIELQGALLTAGVLPPLNADGRAQFPCYDFKKGDQLAMTVDGREIVTDSINRVQISQCDAHLDYLRKGNDIKSLIKEFPDVAVNALIPKTEVQKLSKGLDLSLTDTQLATTQWVEGLFESPYGRFNGVGTACGPGMNLIFGGLLGLKTTPFRNVATFHAYLYEDPSPIKSMAGWKTTEGCFHIFTRFKYGLPSPFTGRTPLCYVHPVVVLHYSDNIWLIDTTGDKKQLLHPETQRIARFAGLPQARIEARTELDRGVVPDCQVILAHTLDLSGAEGQFHHADWRILQDGILDLAMVRKDSLMYRYANEVGYRSYGFGTSVLGKAMFQTSFMNSGGDSTFAQNHSCTHMLAHLAVDRKITDPFKLIQASLEVYKITVTMETTVCYLTNPGHVVALGGPAVHGDNLGMAEFEMPSEQFVVIDEKETVIPTTIMACLEQQRQYAMVGWKKNMPAEKLTKRQKALMEYGSHFAIEDPAVKSTMDLVSKAHSACYAFGYSEEAWIESLADVIWDSMTRLTDDQKAKPLDLEEGIVIELTYQNRQEIIDRHLRFGAVRLQQFPNMLITVPFLIPRTNVLHTEIVLSGNVRTQRQFKSPFEFFKHSLAVYGIGLATLFRTQPKHDSKKPDFDEKRLDSFITWFAAQAGKERSDRFDKSIRTWLTALWAQNLRPNWVKTRSVYPKNNYPVRQRLEAPQIVLAEAPPADEKKFVALAPPPQKPQETKREQRVRESQEKAKQEQDRKVAARPDYKSTVIVENTMIDPSETLLRDALVLFKEARKGLRFVWINEQPSESRPQTPDGTPLPEGILHAFTRNAQRMLDIGRSSVARPLRPDTVFKTNVPENQGFWRRKAVHFTRTVRVANPRQYASVPANVRQVTPYELFQTMYDAAVEAISRGEMTYTEIRGRVYTPPNQRGAVAPMRLIELITSQLDGDDKQKQPGEQKVRTESTQ